jgi:transposase
MFKYFVGVDVAKDSFSVAIIDERNNTKFQFSAKMNKEGIEKLVNTLNSITKKEEIIIGMESSGSYHLNLFYSLTDKGYRVVIINPLIVANFAKLSLRKCKTDKKDAFTIAKVLSMQKFNQTMINQELKELAREREFLTYEIAKIKNEIKRVIHMLFPEIEYKCFIFSKTILRILLSYPSANAIAHASFEEINKLMKRKIKISTNELIGLAKNSIGINSKALEIVLVCKIGMLIQMEENIEKITKLMIKQAQFIAHEDIDILTSIDGIDVVSAAHFIAEIGDIRRFSSYKKLIAYAGLDPSIYQSGKFESRSKLSQKGNRHLRRILWIMCSNVVFRNPIFRVYFMKRMSEGKPYKMAMMCAIHKLIRTIYSMLTYRTHFIYQKEALCQNFS